MAKLLLHAGHHDCIEPTRIDPLKVTKVGVNVQSDPMKGDPTPTCNADRGQLATIDPHASLPRLATSVQTEVCTGLNHRLLEIPKERVQIPLAFEQRQNRVANDLSRAMVG